MIDREAIAAYEARRRKRQQEFLCWRAWQQVEAASVIRAAEEKAAYEHWCPSWKRRQRAKTREAIKRGLIKRTSCHVCGTGRKEHRVQVHHWDYGKPLDVYFVCQRCHITVHRVLKAVERAWDAEIRELPASIYG